MVVTPSTRPTSSAHHRCCHFLPATTTHSSPQSDPHHENLEPVNESHQMHVQLNNARVSQTNSTMITTTGKPRAGIRATRLNNICTGRPLLGGHVPTSAWQVRTAGCRRTLLGRVGGRPAMAPVDLVRGRCLSSSRLDPPFVGCWWCPAQLVPRVANPLSSGGRLDALAARTPVSATVEYSHQWEHLG